MKLTSNDGRARGAHGLRRAVSPSPGFFPGRNRLLIQAAPEWKAIDTSVFVAAKTPLQVHLVLAHLAQDLEAVHVISQDECPSKTLEGFDCRRRAGIGAFRDSAEIAALHPVCVSDITYGMEGLRRTPGSRGCSSFIPTAGWRCLKVLVDGAPARMALRMTDYIGEEFYADYRDAPEWYKQYAFDNSRVAVPLHQDFKGGPFVYRTPAVGGRNCSLIVYWTHFATRSDPSLVQSKATTIMMKARRDSLAHMLDSIRHGARYSTRKKKPRKLVAAARGRVARRADGAINLRMSASFQYAMRPRHP